MKDEFSINDVTRKRSRKSVDDSGLDELRDTDHGETAWALNEDGSTAGKAEPDIKASDDDMPIFPPIPGLGDEEEQGKPSSIDIIRLLRGVWARRNLVLGVAGVITLLFLALAFTLLHHTWKANVVLIKRDQLDQFQVGRFGTPFKQQKYSLKTMLDTLKLPSVLTETISKSEIEVPLRTLSQQIGVNLGKESNIFSISVTWDDPRLAAKIANKLAESFIERNLGMRRSDAMQVYGYYGAQLASAEENSRKIYAQLLEFQETHEVVDLDSQMQVLLVKVADLEVEYRTLKAEVEVDQLALQRLQEKIKVTPDLVVSASFYRNPLQQKLSELEWQLEQARGRYTDKNPKVADLIEQVNTVKKLIKEGKDEATQEQTYAANAIKQEFEIKSYELEAQIKLKNAQVDSLKNSLDIINGKLSTMTTKQKEYFQLTAERDSINGVIEHLRNRVEEARVIMLSGKGDFDIVEQARIPDQPESSGRKVMVLAGGVLGGGAGLLLALLLEFLSPLVRTRREVIGITEVEKVFEFQHVPSHEQDVIDVKEPGEKVVSVFRRIVNDLLSGLSEDSLQSVAFVSAERGSGRSLVVTNMAQAMSLKEERCLLVDADLARGAGTTLAEYYEADVERQGLLSVLKSESKLTSAIVETQSPNVSLLPLNSQESQDDEHASLLLGSRRMSNIVVTLRKFNGHVFYDLPPLVEYETAYEAAAKIGKAIVVVRSGVCHKRDIKSIVERLRASDVEVLAVLLTDVPANLMQSRIQFEEKTRKMTRQESF